MKKLIFILLLAPLFVNAQSDASLNTEADSLLTNTPHQNNSRYFRRMFRNIISAKPNFSFLGTLATKNTINNSDWSGTVLSKTNGGTGTGSPNLIAGTNISITGTWPNQTISQTGLGGGITNAAANNELMKSDGTNAIGTTIFNPSPGDLSLGTGYGGGATRTLNADGTGSITGFTFKTNISSSLVDNFSFSNSSYFLGTGISTSATRTMIADGTGSNIDFTFKTKTSGSFDTKLTLKATGSLSWTAVTLVNGWGNNTNHSFRITPDDRLEVTFNLTSGSATNSTLGSASGLTIPTPVSGGFPSSLVFVGNNASGAFIYIRADITATGVTFICPNYASAGGAVQVTGSLPLTAAF